MRTIGRNAALGAAGAGVLMAALCGSAVLAQDGGARERDRDRRPVEPWLAGVPGPGSSLGLAVRDASTDEAQKAKLSPAVGVVVTRVQPGGPGEKAGVVVGDVVAEFDGERVRSARQLARLVRESAAGRPIKATIVRDGARRSVDLTPADGWDASLALPPDFTRDLDRRMRELSQRFEFRLDGENVWGGFGVNARGRLGATLVPVSDQLATYFGVQRGVLVSAVSPDSPAVRAGLKAGDVITQVNGRGVESGEDVAAEVRRADSGASVALTVVRDKKELKLTAKMPETARPRRGRSI